MKRNLFRYVFFFMVALMCTVVFSSCGGSDDVVDPDTPSASTTISIVGTWYCLCDNEYVVLDFESDGTGFIRDADDPNNYTVRASDKFTYAIIGNSISLHFSYSVKNKNVTYTLNSDGKSLTVYGLDDNDLAIATFVKRQN